MHVHVWAPYSNTAIIYISYIQANEVCNERHFIDQVRTFMHDVPVCVYYG